MSIISPLPNTLTNGSVADANQVMADFNQIVSNVNANAADKNAGNNFTQPQGGVAAVSRAQFPIASQVQDGTLNYAVDTSVSANTITAALTPAISGYATGVPYWIKVANTVTGATVVNLNTIGNVSVFNFNGMPIQANQLLGGRIYGFVYDGTNLYLLNPSSPGQSTISGNTTLAAASNFSGTYNVTATAAILLPVANTVPAGTSVKIKSSTTGNVTVARQSADTIDGVTIVRIGSFDVWEFESNGVNGWLIVRRGSVKIGGIVWSASSTADIGYAAALGTLSRTTFAGLFAEIGTNMGVGDGSTTFGVDTAGRSFVSTGQAVTTEVIVSQTASGNAVPIPANNTKWTTGMPIVVSGASGFVGLVNGSFFIIRASSTSFKIATTLANALAGIAVTVTGTGSATLTYTGNSTRAVGEIIGEEGHSQAPTEVVPHNHNVTDGGHNHTEQVWSGGGGLAGFTFTNNSTSTAQVSTNGSTSTDPSNITIQTAGSGAAANIMQPGVGLFAYIKT